MTRRDTLRVARGEGVLKYRRAVVDVRDRPFHDLAERSEAVHAIAVYASKVPRPRVPPAWFENYVLPERWP